MHAHTFIKLFLVIRLGGETVLVPVSPSVSHTGEGRNVQQSKVKITDLETF